MSIAVGHPSSSTWTRRLLSISTRFHSTRTMATRNYADAIVHLNSLQSNAATLEAVRASGGRLSEFAIPEMVEYLGRIGYTPKDLNKLNVLHVTGTKGKGSTSAFASSILQAAMPSWKIGLYTSPHLVAVRERIRINGAPLSEDVFAKYFFQVWDRLDANKTRLHESTSDKPMYFRFMTLVAFHAFLDLKVDATILEVGVGGAYDSTNIVPAPVVTGITALGIDHTAVLGKTLKEIAWQKGGIFKEGVPALTVPQPEEGMIMLRQQASTLKASKFVVVPEVEGIANVKLGISGAHQLQNANLAVHLSRSFLTSQTDDSFDEPLPASFVRGLEATRWPGRCQTVVDPKFNGTTWFIDGAHTLESLTCCMQWFVSPDAALRLKTEPRTQRVLVFNCTNGRSGSSFLLSMQAETISQLKLHSSAEVPSLFDHVIFCANVTYADGHFKGDLTTMSIPEADLAQLQTQQTLASAWRELNPSFPSTNIHVLGSIEHAVNVVRGLDVPVDVLVTGSLLLVGGVIEVAGLAEVAL